MDIKYVSKSLDLRFLWFLFPCFSFMLKSREPGIGFQAP